MTRRWYSVVWVHVKGTAISMSINKGPESERYTRQYLHAAVWPQARQAWWWAYGCRDNHVVAFPEGSEHELAAAVLALDGDTLFVAVGIELVSLTEQEVAIATIGGSA